MIVKIIGKANLYLWDREKRTLEIIDASLVEVSFVDRKPIYKLKEKGRDVIIVQALNEKKAASKLLTKITQWDERSTH